MRTTLQGSTPAKAGRRLAGALTLATTLLPLAASAQPSAPGALQGFEPTGDYIFEISGEPQQHAEVFFSERAVSYLIIAPELASPILLSPRTQAVEQVDLLKVVKKESGSVDLLTGAVLGRLGPFSVKGEAVSFKVDGRPATLTPRPPLLGLHAGADLVSDNPDYGRKAALYAPIPADVDALGRLGKNVRVRVYFGSWCPVCKRLVPHVLRVADSLAGSKIGFEFYGLPRPMSDDPETEKADIHGVPTAVVFVDGKEVGRLSGNDLNAPEASLRKLLGG